MSRRRHATDPGVAAAVPVVYSSVVFEEPNTQSPLLQPKSPVSPEGSTPVSPLLSQRTALYARRWWVLFLLSLVSCQQSCLWLTFSPIQDEVHRMYG